MGIMVSFTPDAADVTRWSPGLPRCGAPWVRDNHASTQVHQIESLATHSQEMETAKHAMTTRINISRE
jgi:hypothetical protein